MTGDERRQGIINDIMHAKEPISGTALAKKYEVSRQVIVQDIALLRAGDYEIFLRQRDIFCGRRKKFIVSWKSGTAMNRLRTS